MKTLILRKTKTGKGVFANVTFRKCDKIIEFKGKLITRKQLPYPYEKVDDRYVQIGKNLYMSPSGKLDDFINHSCNPNSGLVIKGRKAVLTAIRKIKTGEEICWDYSTTMNEDEWEMDCSCGSKSCRKRIRDFKFLPKKTQQKYIKLGIAPKYIVKN